MRFLGALGVAVSIAACSSSSSSPVTGADADAGASDGGASFTEADHPAAPSVVKKNGSVLASPKLVVVTFADEPLAAQVESFAGQIGASKYWSAVTAEYGVGAPSFVGAVHVAAPPATTVSTNDLESWLVSQLDGTHADWPAPDGSTIYTIVWPQGKGSGIQVDGAPPCGSSPAYHYEVKLPNGTHVPYAAINRCDPIFGLKGIDYVTAGLSHEWVEATTDPLYASAPAYQAPQEDAWTLVTGGEVADMCTTTDTVYFKPDDLAFTVQRSWSNAAASAGHDPCVPAPPGPYFGAAPVLGDTLKGRYYGEVFSTTGVKAAVGASATIPVELFSDAPTDDAFSVKAASFGGANLDFAWDSQSGKNGDTLQLTVTRKADAPQTSGASFFTITSVMGSRESVWIGAIGD